MARKFARWSAIGSLALSMLGQVIYHVLAAAYATRASWPVVVLVSCLPVVTLGFGAALTHLLRPADDAAQAVYPAPATVVETVADVPGPVSVAVSAPAPLGATEIVAPVTGAPVVNAAPEGVSGVTPQQRSGGRTVARKHIPRRTPEQRAERAFAAELAAGKLPSLRAVMSILHVGQPKVRDVVAHLASLVTGPEAAA
jgi:hypothetical protein